jgi:hypothetical protein
MPWIKLAFDWIESHGGLVAWLALLISIGGVLWTFSMRLRARPHLRVTCLGTLPNRIPDGQGGTVAGTGVGWYQLRLINTSEQVPLTVLGLGYRRRWSCALLPVPCFIGHPERDSYHLMRPDESIPLGPGQAAPVRLVASELGPLVRVAAIYAVCSRGHRAWLPAGSLRGAPGL